ncbi:divergent polysaccharide deacetylase family protein [Ferrovibrio sp.]|uniref:divergent polysaccharide deacetylase family protein n=1 Tax=Ferrovibrio sp. TaxID=1917215 RepID=UPI0026348B90|nr:divergent polysaccharide deacetylase family protein [Ferrovibrio sp.]
MAEQSDLHVDPDDRAVPGRAPKQGLLKRLLGRFGRRKKPAAVGMDGPGEMPGEMYEAMQDSAEPDADLIQTITGMDDDAPTPPRRKGFKHKIAGLFRIIGLILWPPFLRGDFSTVNRRLLLAAWTAVLLILASVGGWLVTTGENLTSLPGSEVVIGVARLALPPEAKLATDQKLDKAAPPPVVGRLPSGLLVAPDPTLSEATPRGLVPKIGADGRQPWNAYARPFDEPPTRPRLAIVLQDMGLNAQLTALAAERLPPAITFAFNPYAPDLAVQIERARSAGHEVLLGMPMEPFDYPTSDPGPYTLLTSLSDQENVRRLDWLLARASGYIGFTNLMGGKYTSSPEHMRGIALKLKERGLMFVDTRVAPRSVAAKIMRDAGGVYAFVNRQIDAQPGAQTIDARLDELERTARAGGIAIGSAMPYPVTLDRLLAWADRLEAKGIALAPVSAIANRQTPE